MSGFLRFGLRVLGFRAEGSCVQGLGYLGLRRNAFEFSAKGSGLGVLEFRAQ